MMNRRHALKATAGGALWLAGPGRAQSLFAPAPALAPINARADRLMRITVCLRPFRAAGPRIAVERIAGKQVIHHYGHGGSGWSLGWGSAMEAVPLALQAGAREVAVVGAGAIGLTTALTAQRLGLKVVIYAQERFPDVRSARATGTWTPHSRIAMAGAVDPGFAARWERMARRSHAIYQSFLGRAGNPVEFYDRYTLFDAPPGPRGEDMVPLPGGGSDHFVNYEDQVRDLSPGQDTIAAGQHPFAVPVVRRTTSMLFNIADLAHQLEADFLMAGGRFVPMTLASPADFGRIREKVIFNCTGYGARTLMRDESIIPVRGQIAWLLPQPEVRYGVYYNNISMLPRRDGMVVQDLGATEAFGFNDANEAPDPAAARASLAVIAGLFQPRTA
ncbi:FAD-dependent oxidoreductase [Sandarakinorhabdus rubra]|uniref:FAD-dependent oxidoreductase n=1 Tax=Sandarakinorhabdus rubra TaxID=2672568 RepID=UPI0013D9BE43|nr:FAD-dependent oxidoreductase [Sandarakinorhabdus rubra]